MKTSLSKPWIIARVLLLTSTLLLSAKGADPKDTYWTNVKGVTIWARLAGMEGSNVILVKSGRDYRVAASTLTEESRQKACRLLNVATLTCRDVRPSEHKAAVIEKKGTGISREQDLVKFDLPVISEFEESESAEYAGVLPPKTSPGSLDVMDPLEDTVRQQGPGNTKMRLVGKQAIAPSAVPSLVRTVIAAGNRLQTKTYKWGGGRARLEDDGYDCSGSVSYVLIKAGLLRSPITSGSFTRYGQAGPGRWITIYARNGHVFMSVCGLRLDTGWHGRGGERGPRWCLNARSSGGFVMRHPTGL